MLAERTIMQINVHILGEMEIAKLQTVDNIAMMDACIVIPQSLCKHILKNLHAANQWISSIESRAKMSVYWPGMVAQMRELEKKLLGLYEIFSITTSRAHYPHYISRMAIPTNMCRLPGVKWGHPNLHCQQIQCVVLHLSLQASNQTKSQPKHLLTFAENSLQLMEPQKYSSVMMAHSSPQTPRFAKFLTFWNVKHQISSVR